MFLHFLLILWCNSALDIEVTGNEGGELGGTSGTRDLGFVSSPADNLLGELSLLPSVKMEWAGFPSLKNILGWRDGSFK